MKKVDLTKWIVIFVAFAVIVFLADYRKKEENKIEEIEYIDLDLLSDNDYDIEKSEIHTTLSITGEGENFFTCNGYGYRYGPSIIYYEDGSMDMWVSSPGNNSTQWDYIRYMHSDDGVNWGAEKVVLTPTSGSLDHYSVCDPGVIYFNGYYYLGYTSTTNPNGYENKIYVARSIYPDGPFEKWNGSGWGGSPAPFIDFFEGEQYWGAGEVSFCIKDDVLYCYYSYHGKDGGQTRVCISDLSENWPANIQFRGVSSYRSSGEDSSDVAYIESIDRFVSFSIGNRLSEESNIIICESSDGYNFEKSDSIVEGIHLYCHSVGVSKKPDGSINVDDDLCIGYAYGNEGWGKWSACIQPIKISGYMVVTK